MMTEIFNTVLEAVRNAPPSELPEVVGELARLQAVAQSRLHQPPAPAPKVAAIDEWLTVPQVCELLHVSKSFVYHAKRHGLRSRKVGHKLLFSRRALEQFLERESQ